MCGKKNSTTSAEFTLTPTTRRRKEEELGRKNSKESSSIRSKSHKRRTRSMSPGFTYQFLNHQPPGSRRNTKTYKKKFTSLPSEKHTHRLVASGSHQGEKLCHQPDHGGTNTTTTTQPHSSYESLRRRPKEARSEVDRARSGKDSSKAGSSHHGPRAGSSHHGHHTGSSYHGHHPGSYHHHHYNKKSRDYSLSPSRRLLFTPSSSSGHAGGVFSSRTAHSGARDMSSYERRKLGSTVQWQPRGVKKIPNTGSMSLGSMSGSGSSATGITPVGSTASTHGLGTPMYTGSVHSPTSTVKKTRPGSKGVRAISPDEPDSEREAKRLELESLDPSDFIAWSMNIFPDDGPEGKFLARAVLVRHADAYTGREWASFLAHFVVMLNISTWMFINIGPVTSLLPVLVFIYLYVTESELPSWLIITSEFCCLGFVLNLLHLTNYGTVKQLLSFAVVVLIYGVARRYIHRHTNIRIPKAKLPHPTPPKVAHFEENEIEEFLGLKRRFGLMNRTFVGNYYVESTASVLVPSRIYNSARCRWWISFIADVVLPLTFVLAACHHGLLLCGKLKERIDRDPMVIIGRFMKRLVPWNRIPIWAHFSFYEIFAFFSAPMYKVVTTIVLPLDEVVTLCRARFQTLLNALRPLNMIFSHISVPFLVAGKAISGIAQSFAWINLSSLRSMIEVPIAIIRGLIQMGGDLCRVLGSFFAGLIVIPFRVIGTVAQSLQGVASMLKNQILWGTPTSGRSLGWWKFVSTSIAELWAKIESNFIRRTLRRSTQGPDESVGNIKEMWNEHDKFDVAVGDLFRKKGYIAGFYDDTFEGAYGFNDTPYFYASCMPLKSRRRCVSTPCMRFNEDEGRFLLESVEFEFSCSRGYNPSSSTMLSGDMELDYREVNSVFPEASECETEECRKRLTGDRPSNNSKTYLEVPHHVMKRTQKYARGNSFGGTLLFSESEWEDEHGGGGGGGEGDSFLRQKQKISRLLRQNSESPLPLKRAFTQGDSPVEYKPGIPTLSRSRADTLQNSAAGPNQQLHHHPHYTFEDDSDTNAHWTGPEDGETSYEKEEHTDDDNDSPMSLPSTSTGEGGGRPGPMSKSMRRRHKFRLALKDAFMRFDERCAGTADESTSTSIFERHRSYPSVASSPVFRHKHEQRRTNSEIIAHSSSGAARKAHRHDDNEHTHSTSSSSFYSKTAELREFANLVRMVDSRSYSRKNGGRRNSCSQWNERSLSAEKEKGSPITNTKKKSPTHDKGVRRASHGGLRKRR